MVNVLLVDVDSTKPNLALMKLSAFHKNLGRRIFLNQGCSPDKVFVSCIFKKNRSQALDLTKMFNCPVEIGGYGVNDKQLPFEVEHMRPDYSLYGTDYSMGYTSRGCIRKCPFCIVWKKEGEMRDHASIGEFWLPEHRKVMLLDNNFLASPKWKENIQFLVNHQLQVTFCQGLDIRLVNDDTALWLGLVDSRTMSFKSSMYYFAFDDPSIEDDVRRGVAKLGEHGIKPYRLTFYMLVGFNTTHREDMHRFKVLRELKTWPYVMKYNDDGKDIWLNHFDRWVNAYIFQKCSFEDYEPHRKVLDSSVYPSCPTRKAKLAENFLLKRDEKSV